MAGRAPDEDRERRIRDEVIVDAYGPAEQALGWYYWLQANITWPWQAACAVVKATSPLCVGQSVEVIGLADEDDCRHDMVVLVPFAGPAAGGPAVPA